MSQNSNFSGHFARLTPRNHVAQLLFSETFIFVEKNDTFHLRLMDRTGGAPAEESCEAVEESTDYDTSPDDRTTETTRTIQHTGHFILSFDQNRLPEMPHLGWRVGRGSNKSPANRGVDLLLSRPGDILSKSLASVHMLFRFNPRSGFLMLVGGSSKVEVEYKVHGVWESLGFQEQRLLYQSATMIRAGTCEYELEYTMAEEDRESYFQKRNIFLERLLSTSTHIRPPKPLQHLPGDSCILRGRYLEFETQGFGSFGWVTHGVDIKNGDLIAIKELRINSRRSRDEAMKEVNLGRRVQVSYFMLVIIKRRVLVTKAIQHYRGLLPTLEAHCEHGYSDSCSNMERFHIFMPQALFAFLPPFWQKPDIPRTNKLQWLREILEGIEALHSIGIMHRDIRPQNMLVMSVDPGRACLCDYGKAIEATSDTVTTIGPIHTLAPEVWWVSAHGPYTNKIDMWAYGYAIAEILGYTVQKFPGLDPTRHNNNNNDKNPPINPDRHGAILKMLYEHGTNVLEDVALVNLAQKLLEWRPGDRWSAAQALEHECWAPIMDPEPEVKSESVSEHGRAPGRQNAKGGPDKGQERAEGPSRKAIKRIQRDNNSEGDVDRGDKESRDPDELPTQEFSQETKEYIRRTYAWK